MKNKPLLLILAIAGIAMIFNFARADSLGGPLYYSGANVGIYNPSPAARLHIIGGGSSGAIINGYSKAIIEDNDHAVLTIATPNDKLGQIAFADPRSYSAGSITYNHATDMMSFGTIGGTQILNIDAGANVGINTTNPKATFHVVRGYSGVTNFNGYSKFIMEGNDHTVFTIATPNDKMAQIDFADPDSPYAGSITYNHATDLFSIGNQVNSQILNIDINGNTGLNNTAPRYRLDVAGKINTSDGLCINGVCKSSWDQLSTNNNNTNTENLWTKNGDNVYVATGTVSIGTTTPSANEKLNVNGDIKINGDIKSDGDICIGVCK